RTAATLLREGSRLAPGQVVVAGAGVLEQVPIVTTSAFTQGIGSDSVVAAVAAPGEARAATDATAASDMARTRGMATDGRGAIRAPAFPVDNWIGAQGQGCPARARPTGRVF